MKLPKWARRALLFLIIIVMMLLLVSLFRDQDNENPLGFGVETYIFHGVKVEAQPKSIKNRKLMVNLSLESFEHPEFLEMSPADICMLIINDSLAIEASEWIQSEADEYHISGRLSFPWMEDLSIDMLSLLIFEYDIEHRIDWVKED